MGEAKRRVGKVQRITEGACSGCTLCCVVPMIDELQKPAFHACRHIANGGCAIHASSERPEPCVGFRCRYIQAHALGSDERHILPHPLVAGAHAFEPFGHKVMALCVDPDRPNQWKKTGLPHFLAAFIQEGFKVQVLDRGYSMHLPTLDHLRDFVSKDYVEGARQMGKVPNAPGYIGGASKGDGMP